MQNPGTDYTIAASTITFTTAPAVGLSFWALILGAGINTATVADQVITNAKISNSAAIGGSKITPRLLKCWSCYCKIHGSSKSNNNTKR